MDNVHLLTFASYALIICVFIRLYATLTTGWCQSSQRLDRKTVLITGANAGIGKETARQLAARGARVVMACRSVDKGRAVASDIARITGNGDIEVMECDLSSLDSVRSFCERFEASETRLDVVVLNAGFIPGPGRHLSVDGIERLFATNHLGHFLLVNKLLTLLKRSAPARVVVVSSILHHFGQIEFDNLNLERFVSEPFYTYATSKLANLLMMMSLARRLRGSGVTVNAVHPGLVATDINRHRPWWVRLWLNPPLVSLYGKSCEEGAQTSVHLAVSEELEGVTGKYFSDCCESWMSYRVHNDEVAEKLWEVSAEMAGLLKIIK